MIEPVRAIYQDGVLKPREPVSIPNGTEVEVIIVAARGPRPDPRHAAQALAEIASLPMETDTRGFSGSDHDEVLYGKDREL